ncbi:MAG: hypothetical protein PHE83_14910 [Opitutaceae bacterium]|nr:hypothetical protein [Opitutaceae bacterium]
MLPPVLVMLCTVAYAGYYGLQRFDVARKLHSKNDADQRALVSATQTNQLLQSRIAEASAELAQAREFLAKWESADSGARRGGLENRFIEPANAYDVITPSPRIEQNPSVFLQTDACKIETRALRFSAEGRVTSLARFYAEAERSIPTGLVRLLQLKAGQRSPELTVEMAILQHTFAAMPELAETPATPAGKVPAVLERRPDIHRSAVPNLSENLIARTVQKNNANGGAGTTDLGQFIPDLKVTGLIWNVEGRKRALLISGYMLHQGAYLPQAMVKGKARVLLTEVGRDFAIFTIETDDLNPVTGKKETSAITREFHFALFNGLSSEG